jgi:hypothetical protein
MAATPALILTGGGVDNSLPEGPPGHVSGGPVFPTGPVDPGFGIPLPPVINGGPPEYVSGGPLPPTYPVDPGYDIPIRPGLWPNPPRPPGVWPPPTPVYPSFPIYIPGHVGGGPMPGGRPDQGLPPAEGQHPDQGPIAPPGAVWPPLPGASGKLLCFAWVVGYGYRWVVIDTSLEIGGGPVVPPSTVPGHPSHQPVPQPGHPGHPLPPAPARPDQELPPTAQPRR